MPSKEKQSELIALASRLIEALENAGVPVFFVIGEEGKRRYTMVVASEAIDGSDGNGQAAPRLYLPDGSRAPRGSK